MKQICLILRILRAPKLAGNYDTSLKKLNLS